MEKKPFIMPELKAPIQWDLNSNDPTIVDLQKMKINLEAQISDMERKKSKKLSETQVKMKKDFKYLKQLEQLLQ